MSGGVPAGWVMVPVEPTKAMIEAGKEGGLWSDGELTFARNVYKSMLAATPTPPIEGRDADVERVARAMYCADNGMPAEGNEAHLDYWFDNPDENDKGGVEDYRTMARAALQALGERG